MTAINFAFTAERLWLVTDSLVTSYGSGERRGFTTKAVAIPHLRVVMASMGQCEVTREWEASVLALPGVSGVSQLATLAPTLLEKAWRARDIEASTRSFIFGINEHEMLSAWEFSSENGFEPKALKPGVYLNPNPLPKLYCDPDVKGSWTERTQACVQVMPLQARTFPGIGGRILTTALDAFQLSQSWQDGLDT